MAAGKANALIKRQRLDRVLAMMGRGKMRYQIIQTLSEEWGMKEWGIQEYITAANKVLKAGFSDEDLIAGYMAIFDKTFEESPAVALKAYDSIAKLKGRMNDKTEIVTVININRDGDKENSN